MYSNMPLADVYLLQKALCLKGWKKLCKWKESRCQEIKLPWVSQTCRMAKLGRELTNIYLVSEKYYRTSCVLKQPFQTTPAHAGKMRSELPWWEYRMKSRAADLGSSSSIQLLQLLLQVTEPTGQFFTISKVSLYSSNFLRRIITISVTRTPYWCYGIYYGISTAYRWFTRNQHRSLWTSIKYGKTSNEPATES